MGQSQQTKIINAKMKAKEWQWELKSEAKNMDKEIKKIQQQEQKLQKEIMAQAAKNNVSTVQQLTRQVVRSRGAVKRLEKTKANLFAVDLQLTTSIATMSTTSSLAISADILARMNKIANTDGVGQSMEAMRREMAKMGEAEDAMEEAMRDSDEEEEAAVEMQKVMEEMALDIAQFGPLAAKQTAVPQAQEPEQEQAKAPPAKQAVMEGGAPAPKPQVQPAPVIQPPPPAVDRTASIQSVGPMGYSPTQTDGVGAFNQPMAPAPSMAPGSAAGADGGIDQDELMKRLMCLKK